MSSETREDAPREVERPTQLFRPDPVLGWTLTPNSRVRVPFRETVIQTIDGDGWRHVPGRPKRPLLRLAVYGCSFTYGTCLSDAETYVARLQRAFPEIAFLNRGVGGHGTVQAYLQFRRDLRAGAVDAAIFTTICDHRYRNILHPRWMERFRRPDWAGRGPEHWPVAGFDRRDRLRIEYRSLNQAALDGPNFSDFLPGEREIDRVTMGVLDAIDALASARDLPVAFALLDRDDEAFAEFYMAREAAHHDISLPPGEAYTFRPFDPHPNVAANRLFASRLEPVVTELVGQALPGAQALAS